MIAAPPDAAPAINASRFRAAHAADWERLDALVTRMERRSVRALTDEELLALPLLYRTTLSTLSAARATSLDRALVAYLEQLGTRAYFQLYGVRTPPWRQLARFFVSGWPQAVQALWRETAVAVALTVLGTIAGWLLVRADPSWFFGIVPDGMAGDRTPGASAATLAATLHGGERTMLATFAASLFTHNAQIALFAFALGIVFAVPTVLLVLYNGLMLGAMLALFAHAGLGGEFGGWLFIHGTTELFAIALAGAAGLRIGTAIAFPGREARGESAVRAGRAAGIVMAGAVVMLAVAGLLEGIGRQTVDGTGARYLIGAAMLAGWCLYFYLPRGRARAE